MAKKTCIDCGKTLGLLERFNSRCSDCRKKHAQAVADARASYHDRLRQALSDGKLDKWEREELEKMAALGQLSPAEVKNASLALYEEARINAIGDRVLTQEEYDYLVRLQTQLEISDTEIAHNLRELTRLRLLTEIRDGILPEVDTTTVVLKAGEYCHLECDVELIEEKTISRTIVADSSSRTKSRGSLSDSYLKCLNVTTTYETQQRQAIPIDQGVLTITSQRCIFSGQRDSFAMPYDKLLSVGLSNHGVRLGVEGRKGVRIFSADDDELVAAVVGKASRTYHDLVEAGARSSQGKRKVTARAR